MIVNWVIEYLVEKTNIENQSLLKQINIMTLKMTGGEVEIVKKGLLFWGKQICPLATVRPLMDFTIDLNAENRTLVLRRFAALDFIYVLNKHCVLCNYVTNNKEKSSLS